MSNKSERKDRRSLPFTLSDNDPIVKKFREGFEAWVRPGEMPTVTPQETMVQTRGGPIRVGGPVRTGGKISSLGKKTPLKPKPPSSIDELIDQTQQEVGDIPLTIVIHGSWDEAALSFYKALVRKIPDSGKRNIWLIPPKDEDTTSSEVLPQDILELKEKSDDGLYDNFFSDIVFITTAAKENRLERLSHWVTRSNSIIIQEPTQEERSQIQSMKEELIGYSATVFESYEDKLRLLS